MRAAGLSAIFDVEGKSLKSQMKAAGGGGHRFALILGPDELERGEAMVKDLDSSEQRSVPRESVAAQLLAGERDLVLPSAREVERLASLLPTKVSCTSSKVLPGAAHACLDDARALNLRVGLLDADVFGPSVPILMNLAEAGMPAIDERKRMLPLENYGVKCMSMGFLIPEERAAVWRGPMVMGALGKMVRDTAWAPLDVLFVDMPPGTGDAQISISQQIPLTGAVIVSTPQEIALADVRRGVNMYTKVAAPILGFVENMAHFVDADGRKVYVFGRGGVRRTAEEHGVELLGEVPLDPSIGTSSDAGRPVAVSAPDGGAGRLYEAMARRLIEKTAPFPEPS